MTTARTRPSAILFDWDNTLVDTWPVIHDAMAHVLEAFDMAPWTMDEIKTRVRKSMRDSFPELFGDDWEKAGEIFLKRFQVIHKDRLTVIEGVVELLETLRDLDIPLGIVSNKTGAFLREEISHLGWEDFFNAAVGAADAERDKPDPIVIDHALKGTGVQPSSAVWVVGDSNIDLECAHNAGCTPVLLREKAPGEQEFGNYGPKEYFPTCYSFCNFVQNL